LITAADTGKQNKTLSDNPEPVLALQGVGWLTRKAIGVATVNLEIKQYDGPPSPPSTSETPATHVDIEQTLSAGLTGSTEKRCLDTTFREHTDWLFGHVRGQSKWVKPDEIEDEFLKTGWEEGDSEAVGPDGASHILSYVESLDREWIATQIWGFQVVEGERRYARNVVVTKGEERVAIRMVYDFLE
jgi:hypothetical protein